MNTNYQTTKAAPGCDEVAESLAADALGVSLPAPERIRLHAHLAGCEACRRRQRAYAGVTDALLLQTPLVAPPAGLRERIVGAAQQPAAALPQPPAPARRRRSLTWRLPSFGWRLPSLNQRRALPALGLLAALLLGWGLGMFVQLRQQSAVVDRQSAQLAQQQTRIDQQQAQIDQQQAQAARNRAVAIAAFGNADAQERRLAPAEIAPQAEGRVLISPAAPALALYAKNLPPLAAGQVYHIWWEHDGQAVQLGTFTVDALGRAWSLIEPPTPLALPGQLTITAAPPGEQTNPSGPVYLRAQF